MTGVIGRPRLVRSTRPGLTATEEILDAAAELFTTRGYSATSTRQIAEHAGLRQASLYHYFPTKQAILTSLLLSTVEPALDVAERHVAAGDQFAARLHNLIRFDAALLLANRWNIGALYLLPEVRDPAFEPFLAKRNRLRAAYAQLTTNSQPGIHLVDAALPFRIVESVISIRFDGANTDIDAHRIADIAFRAAGLRPLSRAQQASANAL